MTRTVEWVFYALALGMLVALVQGCALYFPQNVADSILLLEATNGSGCTYFRGNARPYADVSFLTIHTYGKTAPTYVDCLQAIPPEARSLLGY